MQQTIFKLVKDRVVFAVLTFFSFIIPGMGKSGNYCMTKHVTGISADGDALRIRHLHCKRIQCPNCWHQWVRDRALTLSIHVEAYAKVTGERPAAVFVSVPENKVLCWSWKHYIGFFRTGYDRLESLGVMGGVRFFHPFRIWKTVQKSLRDNGYGVKSGKGGLWAGVRENALKLGSWRSYVRLSPHIHCIVFPSFIREHRKNDIVVGKYAVLATTEDVVAHVQYLLSHCGLLTDGENEPAKEFGSLFKFVPENFLDEKELKEIEIRVMKAMGMKVVEEMVAENGDGKSEEEVAGEEEYSYRDDDRKEKEEYTWIPIWQFAVFSAEQEAWTNAFITSIVNPEHRLYIDNLVQLFNNKRTDTELKAYERNVFEDELGLPPDGFEFVYEDWEDIARDKSDAEYERRKKDEESDRTAGAVAVCEYCHKMLYDGTGIEQGPAGMGKVHTHCQKAHWS